MFFFAPKQPAIDTNSSVGDAKRSLVDLLTDNIISSSIVDDAALELDIDRGRLPKSLAAQDIAAVLTACSEQAETSGQMHEEANPEHMDTDSENSVVDESEDKSIYCPPATPVNREDPVLGGFMQETKLKQLASAFMETCRVIN